jgi:hypothetical protein
MIAVDAADRRSLPRGLLPLPLLLDHSSTPHPSTPFLPNRFLAVHLLLCLKQLYSTSYNSIPYNHPVFHIDLIQSRVVPLNEYVNCARVGFKISCC